MKDSPSWLISVKQLRCCMHSWDDETTNLFWLLLLLALPGVLTSTVTVRRLGTLLKIDACLRTESRPNVNRKVHRPPKAVSKLFAWLNVVFLFGNFL